jgi:heterodisulfide reductase subunit A
MAESLLLKEIGMGKKLGRALVVGAGISGIRSALDLAENGYGVTLIDREPHIGGILSQLDHQFPSNHCGMCKMLPLVKRDQSEQFCLRKGLFHENIDILLNTEVMDLSGEPGSFNVTLRERPTGVDPDRCIGCGACEAVCPVEVPDAFNQRLSSHKAIYLPIPHTIPNPFVIDLAACNHCGACEKVCPTQAIQLSMEKRKSFRILVVDDELIVRDSLKEWLGAENFNVETAESGSMAMEKLSQHPFDLMLTDIKMPGMDGVELLQKAKDIHPDLEVLMMTAFATVETAVDAMKIGARDYLMKPFDPEKLIVDVVQIYENLQAGAPRTLEVGAVVLSGGTEYFDPAQVKDIYDYQTNPNVITTLEMERLLSGTGPSQGRLIRPHDDKPITKIAWIQCVGSRDIQCDADFCSTVCCMISIKEALLVKEKLKHTVETAIFYMDMRMFAKSFQRYRDDAERAEGVHFQRARIHSIVTDTHTANPVIRYAQSDGTIENETFDLVVLAVGQRPAAGTQELSEILEIPVNPWGFMDTTPFSPVATGKIGVVAAGSYTGLKDIGESTMHASAAALEASRVLHAAGGSLFDETDSEPVFRDVSREYPRILVGICTCTDRYDPHVNADALLQALKQDPSVDNVKFLQPACTASGWEEFTETIVSSKPNRVLLGACHPYLFIHKLRELSHQVQLSAELMHVVDIMSPFFRPAAETYQANLSATDSILSNLQMGISRLKHMDPLPLTRIPVTRKALILGGGIAGLHAALSIADHGYPVDLVEQTDQLGGNLRWLDQTIEALPIAPLLEDTLKRVENNPLIDLHLQSRITASFGEVGDFYTTIETADSDVQTIQHGVTILATGGNEAPADGFGHGDYAAVLTQKELEIQLKQEDVDVGSLNTVVMIQCVGSRQEPRNYCSRVCCPTSLKQALRLKKANPNLTIYILYRDMMTIGFAEQYFTAARKAGVIFIQYDLDNPPSINTTSDDHPGLLVTALDPILSRSLEIETDLLVLATGIMPRLPEPLAQSFGATIDRDGFFQEAESKWRPVDALKEGVFGCGIVLSPRSIQDSLASAGAAAQRALRILAHDKLAAGKIVSSVRHSLCSLCERCVDTCPYQARNLDSDNQKIVVNAAMCQGCGDCAAACPNSAAILQGFTDSQMLGMIDSAIEAVWPSTPLITTGGN